MLDGAEVDAGLNPLNADSDGDGLPDGEDSDPLNPLVDTDGDGLEDSADNCPSVSNADQADLDGDGIGNACDSDADGDGYTVASGDCNDADATLSPAIAEICDGIDNNCDGSVDEGVTTTFYLDSDGDGYGSTSSPQVACSAPAGYVSDNTDCNDSSAEAYPGAA